MQRLLHDAGLLLSPNPHEAVLWVPFWAAGFSSPTLSSLLPLQVSNQQPTANTFPISSTEEAAQEPLTAMLACMSIAMLACHMISASLA